MAVDLPEGVRAPLALPHARSDEKAFNRATFGLGHTRRRRQFRKVAQTAAIQWRLPHDQLTLWNDWYEDDLQAGALSFLIRIQSRRTSSNLETVEATFIEPPKITISIGWATISGQVRLFSSEVIVTSRIYPVYSFESMNISMALTAGSLIDFRYPPDEMNIAMTLSSGALVNTLLTYDLWPAEAMNIALALTAGSLQSVNETPLYTVPPESMDIAMVLTSGALFAGLITVDTWPPEGMDIAMTLTGGSLT